MRDGTLINGNKGVGAKSFDEDAFFSLWFYSWTWTYHRTIKATPYQVLFNWSPNFHCLDVHNRNILICDINHQEIEDEQDDQLIIEEAQQLRDGITVHESIGLITT